MKYRTITIDPPWKQTKTGYRSVRPNQGRELPYKTMSIEEIKLFPIDNFTDNNCHLYLWTINKYLRDAFDILDAWRFRFHAVLVWNKPTGVCPFSLQFRNEFVLFGYRGKLNLKQIGLPTNFSGVVREHSRKPDELYKLVEAISYPPRIDIFSREKRDGWEQWGDEIGKFRESIPDWF